MAAAFGRGRGVGRIIGYIAAATVLICVLLVVAALVTRVDDPERQAEQARENQPVLAGPTPVLAELPAHAPTPDPGALAAILDPLASAAPVGDLTGVVVDNATGQPLWSRDALRARTPASTTKLLTGLAAHLAVPADARLRTTLAAAAEDTLVVIPGGDVTMTKAAESTFFPGAATLDQLVDLARSTGQQWKRVVVAPGPYEGPDMAESWDEADIGAGYLTRAQPWMLDAGRVDPTENESTREGQPAYAAAVELAKRLGLDDKAVTMSPDPVSVTSEIGAVESATLAERSRSVSDDSDNVGADALCHELAMHRTGIAAAPPVHDGQAGWSDPAQRVAITESTTAVLDTLRSAGIDMRDTALSDCSGMSGDNRISPQVLVDVLRFAARPEAAQAERSLLETLPVAGGTGTLATRYGAGSPEAGGAGWVRAKTGTLTGVSTLAGVVTTGDGRSLSFALMSAGTSPADARPGLDRIAAALRGCGCR